MANAGYFPSPERRRLILAGAKKVFAERGYHETNISHICNDLRIARGTLYQHFDSKRDVFFAIIEDLLERVRRAVDDEPRVDIPPGIALRRDQILRFAARSLRRILGAVFEDAASLRILVRGTVGLDVQIDSVLRSIDEIVVDRFAEDIAIAQRAGILRADVDPRSAALFTMGGVQKLAMAALMRDERPSRRAPTKKRDRDDVEIDLDALALEATRLQMTGLLSPEVKE